MVELHRIARLEAGDAADHYESMQEGLGYRFAIALQVGLQAIRTAPLEHPPWLFRAVPNDPPGRPEATAQPSEEGVYFSQNPERKLLLGKILVALASLGLMRIEKKLCVDVLGRLLSTQKQNRAPPGFLRFLLSDLAGTLKSRGLLVAWRA